MSMAERDGFIWYDDTLVLWRDAAAHVLTYSPHDGGPVLEPARRQAATPNAITAHPQDNEALRRAPMGRVAKVAFFTGIAAGVTPRGSVDGHPSRVVRRRPVAQKRHTAIFDPVDGRHAKQAAGLTPL